jgi:tripartite-type tricarboxylate transporter receptor subunit TctC
MATKAIQHALVSIFVLMLCVPTASVQAQTWPQRPVTILAPYPPGGIVDMTARLVSDGLRERFNQQFIILNKVGGNGLVALTDLVNAPPDGYLLLVNNDGGLVFPPAIDSNFKLDPFKDYTPIAQANQFTWVFMVNSDVPVKTIGEFIAYARQRDFNYASPGNGSVAHVAMERFARQTGLKLTHVPYRGAGPAMTDLLAGVIPVSIVSAPVAIGQIGNPRVRALAVLSSKRLKELPDTPTMAEGGLKDFVVMSWNAFFGPPNMPKDLTLAISRAVVSVVDTPALREKYSTALLEPVAKGSEDFARAYYEDVKRWKDFAAETHMRLSP